jgi:hypothetical protein
LKIRQSLTSTKTYLAQFFVKLLLYPYMAHSQPWYSGTEGFQDYMTEDYAQTFTHRRGGVRSHAAAHPKEALIVIVFYVVILLILVVLAGPTTGTSGIFGNTTVANNVRNAAATLATLTVVIGILAAVGIISDLV